MVESSRELRGPMKSRTHRLKGTSPSSGCNPARWFDSSGIDVSRLNRRVRKEPMIIDLSRRVAVITGASRGLGEAMSLALAEAGAAIALVARDSERLEAVKSKIRTGGGNAEVF